MIVYHPKKWRGFSVLCGTSCLRGSVFLQSLPYGLVAGSIALLVKLEAFGSFGGRFGHTIREDSFFDHPYSLQIWATSLGFLLVFRGNLAYARYWEGRMQLARMCSYYQDAVTVRAAGPPCSLPPTARCLPAG
jgi:predicted membrane chloride channel (bestrophin family)